VTVSLSDDALAQIGLLTVRDTGIGMEPEVLMRIFEPYNQANDGLDRSHGGLGLGLALVKGLVELHGGQVAASSDGPGQGSEFRVRLPLIDEPAVAPPAPAEEQGVQSSFRILIIDDSRDAAFPVQTLLARLGHDARIA